MHGSGFKAPGASATSKQAGDAAEDAALLHLQRAGLRLVKRNYRTPGRGGGEIDLVMLDKDGTTVFVEVRSRTGVDHGGAAASISARKRQRIVFAARHYLMQLRSIPPCRFDGVVRDHGTIEWLRGAFDAT
ncbi:MAG: YraN family protein [Rhodoferax sp.]|nr:YraN family protein [Rhodoferax sp.]